MGDATGMFHVSIDGAVVILQVLAGWALVAYLPWILPSAAVLAAREAPLAGSLVSFEPPS